MENNDRTLLAFVVAPLVVPILFFVNGLVFKHGPNAFGTAFILLYAYAAELVIGFPAWLIFRRYRIRSIWAYTAIGALIGLTIGILLHLDAELSICVLSACCSTLTFRYIAAPS